MSRLADRIRARGIQVHPFVRKWNAQHSELQPAPNGVVEMLKDCEVLVADNVCDYFFSGTDQDVWTVDDFPCLAPPFREFFIEMKAPKTIVTKAKGVQLFDIPIASWGIAFKAFEVPNSQIGTKWNLCGVLVVEYSDNRIEVFPLVWVAPIDPQGRPIIMEDGKYCGWMGIKEAIPPEILDAFISTGMALVNPALLTISLMHCKNVAVKREATEPKLARAYERRHKKPIVRYSVLEIEPMKRVLESEGDVSHNGLKMALHICRGHFKDYREHGLFGTRKGIYWWDAHVRGSAKEGVVVKDYAVNHP